MTPTAATTATERDLYQHVKRPEWGLSVIVAMDDDRTTFFFVDGIERIIKRDHVHLMERVSLVDASTEEAQKKFANSARLGARSTGTKPRAAKKKRAPRAPAAAKAAPATPTPTPA